MPIGRIGPCGTYWQQKVVGGSNCTPDGADRFRNVCRVYGYRAEAFNNCCSCQGAESRQTLSNNLRALMTWGNLYGDAFFRYESRRSDKAGSSAVAVRKELAS